MVTLMGQFAEEAESNEVRVHVTTLIRIGPVTSPVATPNDHPSTSGAAASGWDREGAASPPEEDYDRCVRDIILRTTYIPGYHPLLFEGKVAPDLLADGGYSGLVERNE
jgi:hypothetical protein